MAQGKKTILTEDQKAKILLYASHFCTIKEIIAALDLDCTPETFSNNFRDIYQKGREQGKQILRSLQNKAASNGNVTMLIWLGKQYLGQRETPEIETVIPDRVIEFVEDRSES